jgi:hypothetical protein
MIFSKRVGVLRWPAWRPAAAKRAVIMTVSSLLMVDRPLISS